MSERGMSDEHVPRDLPGRRRPGDHAATGGQLPPGGIPGGGGLARGDVALERARAVATERDRARRDAPGTGRLRGAPAECGLIPSLADVPVVFLTARSPDEDQAAQAGLGPVDFVRKAVRARLTSSS